MKKIIFIGAVNKGKLPTGGEIAKNQILLEYLIDKFNNIILIDTYNWKKSVYILYKLVEIIFFRRNLILIISASTNSVYIFSKFIYYFPRRNKTYYFVIGNTIVDGIKKNKYKLDYYHFYTNIIVEGKSMKKDLESFGLNNVTHLPNFRKVKSEYLRNIPVNLDKNDKIHFVFMSVIKKEKGIDLIFKAMTKLNSDGFCDMYDVSFYGPINPDFVYEFYKSLNVFQNASYKGFLNLLEHQGYHTLANYHAMLFPTYWQGEGFPGAIIDAFIAGLPVIATDWHLNSEIIMDHYNGLLIDISFESLSEKMKYLILNKEEINKMSFNCLDCALKYDYQNVLSHIEL